MNIYCDESCHLPNDNSDLMVLGALVCPKVKVREVSQRIKDIKQKHGISAATEMKWSKVSKSQAQAYCDLIDYYFDNDDLSFRAVIAKEKKSLNHNKFNQDHDDWYFKMYFHLVQALLEPSNCYKVFLDRKDTCSQEKTSKLYEVLCNTKYDFDRRIIQDVRTIVSEHTPSLQIVDILIGALSYIHRDLSGNEGKQDIINRIKEHSKKSLLNTTLMKEKKINLFIWSPQDVS